MHRLGEIVSMLDHTFNTKRKRHIAGGVLLSMSLLFGGLAATILTIKNEDDKNKENYDELYIE